MLKVENIKKQYGSFQLDCSLTIPKGRITGFIGPNGAGKTTVMKSILGLIFPESGNVSIKGRDIREMTAKERQMFGVVLSDSKFCGYFTILDICKIMKQMYPHFQKETFLGQCERFHLNVKEEIRKFSTGQKALLHVLLAISHEAELLVLDEPTVGLDVVVRDEILDLLRSYMEDSRSILITSHIAGDLETLCDDLYMIQNGRIVFYEEMDVLLDHYGICKVTEEQWRDFDKEFIIKTKKEAFGYLCLTKNRQYYLKNYGSVVVEKASVDDILLLMMRGE